MQKILLSLIVAVFISSTTFGQGKEPDYGDAYNVINQWLEAQVAYQHLPGVSAAVVKDQEVIWSKAFGMSNIDQKVKTQTSTVYSICSISKLFTSVAIMQLYDQGKLRLDDPVESVLPNFNIKQQFEGSGPITVRSLLTHSRIAKRI
ncbi:MAG: serine hydrolase domain-containing protein [Cyclobacteriaceae bacterium]